jgi:hypothetical protein
LKRVLLVESGSRDVLCNILPSLGELYKGKLKIDLLTCYTGEPDGLPADAQVFRVWEHATPDARKNLAQTIRRGNYSAIGIICSGEPIMTKWKWWAAWHVPAKLFILNENGDYYWFDYSHWRMSLHFAMVRVGLSGGDATTTITRVLLFPFSLCYLLLYAGFIHLRRKVRA